MAFTEAQLETMNGTSSGGVSFNKGNPCECGTEADTTTTRSRGYSDSMVYKHKCNECGARWETWTEG